MKNAVNMNCGNTGCNTEIVGCYNPHSVDWVWLVTKDGKPVDEGALVELPMIVNEKKRRTQTTRRPLMLSSEFSPFETKIVL